MDQCIKQCRVFAVPHGVSIKLAVSLSQKPIKTAAIGHVQWPSGARCLPMFCTALLIFLLCLPYTQPTVASADHSSTRVYTSIVDQQDLVDETSLVHHKLTEYWCRLSRHQLPELRLQLRSCCVWEGQVFRASPRRK